uniref:Uncharacterized protein n=1 Tax=Cacopsylla melanoneura TaxID=428564 RepID=A0A8D9EZC9_9HEMI
MLIFVCMNFFPNYYAHSKFEFIFLLNFNHFYLLLLIVLTFTNFLLILLTFLCVRMGAGKYTVLWVEVNALVSVVVFVCFLSMSPNIFSMWILILFSWIYASSFLFYVHLSPTSLYICTYLSSYLCLYFCIVFFIIFSRLILIFSSEFCMTIFYVSVFLFSSSKPKLNII